MHNHKPAGLQQESLAGLWMVFFESGSTGVEFHSN